MSQPVQSDLSWMWYSSRWEPLVDTSWKNIDYSWMAYSSRWEPYRTVQYSSWGWYTWHIKSIDWVAYANLKSICWVAMANVKSFSWVA